MRWFLAFVALIAASVAAFSPPARAVGPAARASRPASPPSPTRRNYDGTGKRPTEVKDLPENTPTLILGPPIAFVAIIAIASQFIHLK